MGPDNVRRQNATSPEATTSLSLLKKAFDIFRSRATLPQAVHQAGGTLAHDLHQCGEEGQCEQVMDASL